MDSVAAKAQYTEAKRLFRAGRHAEALALLKELHTAIPYAKHVLLAQAECMVALGDREAARGVCWQILAQEDEPRARRILARCDEGLSSSPPPPLPPSPPPLPLPSASTIESDADEALEPASRTNYRWPLAAIAAVILISGGLALVYELRPTPDEERRIVVAPKASSTGTSGESAAAPVAEHAKMLEERKARRDAAAREAEMKLAAEAEAASKRPGYEIPSDEWNLDPDTGVPAWRPGIYRQLPCAGSWFEFTQAPRTIDVYIPSAYADRTDELFPVLTISMPGQNLGFRGYEAWAERRSVILIVINSSYNEGGTANNREAQLAAYNFLNGRLRTHPYLNFATGASGGAQMSWIAAANSPNMFAGLLMTSHGGYREIALAPHIRVAYVNGKDDWNAPYIVEMMARLRANGNEVRHQVVPGGHIEGPLEVREQMLDWLLDSARKDLETAASSAETSEY